MPGPAFLPKELLGWNPPGSLQLTLTSMGERRWIPVAAPAMRELGWLWNSRYVVIQWNKIHNKPRKNLQ